MKRDPLLWAALFAALVVTASAEYELARACGFGSVVAGAVPAALDVYAVRALRARRDVAAVVLAMIAVNALSHLVSAELLDVSVPLVVAVSAIAPLVLWRVHALREGEKGLRTVETPAPVPPSGSAGTAEPVPVPPGGSAPLPAPATAAVEPATAAPGSRPPATPVAMEVKGGDSGTDLHGKGAAGGSADAPQKAYQGPYPRAPEPLSDSGSVSPAGGPVPAPGTGGTGDRAGGTAERNQDPEPVPDDDGGTAFDRHVSSVRAMLQEDPELSGTAIGTRLGTSDSYGRKVRRAALNGSA